MLTQSGFQIATGKYTFTDPKIQQMMEIEKAKGEGPGSVKIEKKKEVDRAPLLLAYPLAAIAGIVIGLAMPGSVLKKGLLLGCCLAVLLVTAGQAAMGFPIENAIRQDRAVDPIDFDEPMALPQARVDAKPDLKIKMQIAFFFVLLFASGSIITAALEPTSPPARSVHWRRNTYSDDEGSTTM